MRQIVTTADGTKSILITDTDVQYHSKHGAILEAKHVFIHSGLHYYLKSNNTKPISVFEMGFGTGLNCLLTYLATKQNNISIQYTGIEAFPVDFSELKQLNFHEKLGISNEVFFKLHQFKWGEKHQLTEDFSFQKIHKRLQDFSAKEEFDIIYFDAFGSKTQPELWTKEITDQLFEMLQNNGVVVTYSVKGSFRRDLLASGFSVEKIPGPPGKREMLRAIKEAC